MAEEQDKKLVFNTSRIELDQPSGDAKAKLVASRFNKILKIAEGKWIFFNGLTSAMAVLDTGGYSLYKSLISGEKTPSHVTSPVEEGLLLGKFLVHEDFDEIAYLKVSSQHHRFADRNFILTILPTLGCNFACDYCYQDKQEMMTKMDGSVRNAIKKMVEDRATAGDFPGLEVTWYGGEPTIGWDVISDLSEHFIQLSERFGFKYGAGIITNGYLLTQKHIGDMLRFNISFVQITLDGPREYHDTRRVLKNGAGTFDRVINNISSFIGTSIQVSIRVNVDHRNKDGIRGLINSLVEAGLSNQPNISVNFARVTAKTKPSHGVAGFCLSNKDFAKDVLEYYTWAEEAGLATQPRPSLRPVTCAAIKPNTLIVEPDGTLQKCWDLVGFREYSIGNILDTPSFDLSPRHLTWLSWDPFDQQQECFSCTWLPNCMGGCPLRILYPELSPDGKIRLECTSFKYNWKEAFKKIVESTSNAQQAKATTHAYLESETERG